MSPRSAQLLLFGEPPRVAAAAAQVQPKPAELPTASPPAQTDLATALDKALDSITTACDALYRGLDDAFRALGVDPEEVRAKIDDEKHCPVRAPAAGAKKVAKTPEVPADDRPSVHGERHLSAEAVEVLRRATLEGRLLRLPQEQLPPQLYAEIDAALQALGGTWKGGRTRAHVFTEDPAKALEDAVASRTYLDWRVATQFYPTPPDAAAQLIALAEPQAGDRVLEPSAGVGGLLKDLPAHVGEVVAIEQNPAHMATLEKVCARFSRQRCVVADFLTVWPDPAAPFDLVLMNPPFTKGQDARHILHALRFLAPGGRLVAIAPASTTSRSTAVYRNLQQVIQDWGGSWEDLPSDAFHESGVSVKTGILRLVRPREHQHV